jgi:hypothetical protein
MTADTDLVVLSSGINRMIEVLEEISASQTPLSPPKVIPISSVDKQFLTRVRYTLQRIVISNPTAGALAVTLKVGSQPLGTFNCPANDTINLELPFTLDSAVTFSYDAAVNVWLVAQEIGSK